MDEILTVNEFADDVKFALLPFGFVHSRPTWVNSRWKIYLRELTHVENTTIRVNSRSTFLLEWAKPNGRRAILVKCRKKDLLVFKVHFHKAYVVVDWVNLDTIMGKWTSLISGKVRLGSVLKHQSSLLLLTGVLLMNSKWDEV